MEPEPDMTEYQTGKSKSLSKMKKMLDMADGDEHFVSHATTVRPINQLYNDIRELSAFPYGMGRLGVLIHNTQINRR